MEHRFRIKVNSGVHAGGEFSMPDSGTIIVGSDFGADFILKDIYIAPKHCLVTLRGNGCVVRALDGKVRFNDFELDLLKGRTLAVNEEFSLGDTRLILERENSSDSLGTSSDLSNSRVLSVLNWTIRRKSLVAVAAAVLAVLITGAAQLSSPTANAALDQFSIPETTSDYSKEAEVGLPDKVEKVAKNVDEIMRLSGVHSESKLIGSEIIEITGHFGDGKKISEIIGSRSIRELDGLARIVLKNLDHEEMPKLQIMTVVDGAEPYLVMKGGSIYYVGASLPNGYKLAGIEGSDVVFSTPGGTKRAKGVNEWKIDTLSVN